MVRLNRTTATTLFLSLGGAVAVGAPAYALAARNFPLYESVAEVRLLGDPQIGDEAVVGDSKDAATFVSTELVALNSDDLETVVRQQQGGSDLQVEAVQVGTSNVVQLTTRSSRAGLVGTTAVLRRYSEVRRTALLGRIRTARELVDAQFTSTTQALASVGAGQGPTQQVQRAALETELSRLLQQRNTLDLAAASVERLVQVVSGGSQVRQAVQPVRDAALAGLVGAVLGLGAALALLRLRPRVRGLQDLVALSPEVALPTLPWLPRDERPARAGVAAAPYTAALAARGQRFGTPPLAVLAPTAGSGATTVAVGLAIASGRRRPTVLLAAGDVLDAAAARMLEVDLSMPPGQDGARATGYPGVRYRVVVEGTGMHAAARLEGAPVVDLLADLAAADLAVVIDCPPLADSPAGLELARRAGRVLLVGGADRSTAAELEAAARSVRRVGATLAGLVLSMSDWLPHLRRRRSRRPLSRRGPRLARRTR